MAASSFLSPLYSVMNCCNNTSDPAFGAMPISSTTRTREQHGRDSPSSAVTSTTAAPTEPKSYVCDSSSPEMKPITSDAKVQNSVQCHEMPAAYRIPGYIEHLYSLQCLSPNASLHGMCKMPMLLVVSLIF